MAKSKGRSESEHYKGIIRKLKSEIAILKKQVARSDKEYSKILASELSFKSEDLAETTEYKLPKESRPKCVQCSNSLNIIDFGVKTFYTCSSKTCGFRKTVNNTK